MGIELNHKKYDSNINIFYKDKFAHGLAEEIIDYIWNNKLSNQDSFELVKDDNKGRVFKLKHRNKWYYIKVYQHRKISKLLKNIFRSVESIRHFKTLNVLIKRKIPVITPVLALTNKRSFYLTDSIFVTEAFKGDNLYRFLLEKQYITKEFRAALIKKIALLYAQLINGNILNQDPSLLNILINYNNEKITLSLVDIDNAYTYPYLPEKVIFSNLAKFSARVLGDLLRGDIRSLSLRERVLFFKYFTEHCNRNFEIYYLLNEVKKRTVKRLLKHNSRDVIINDNYLEI